MMSSGRAGPPGMRAPRKTVKTGGFAQYLRFLLVALVIIIIIVVVVASTRKTGRRRPVSRAKAGQTGLAERKTAARATSRAKGEEVRASRRERTKRETREERRKRREERRKERAGRRRVTTRTSRGGYTVKRSSTPVLKAIISQPTGERVAVVGDRQVKAGDQVEGRRIVEIGSDRVKVEYFTKSYEVKLNQPLY